MIIMAQGESSSSKKSKAKFLIAFGILWLIAGLFYYRDDMFTSSLPERCTEPAVAKIYDIATGGIANIGSDSDVYTGYITYKVNGTEYSSTFETTDEIQKGETVEILYDPGKPAVFYPKGTQVKQGVDVSTIVVLCIGGVMAGVGGTLLVIEKERKKKKSLKNQQTAENSK